MLLFIKKIYWFLFRCFVPAVCYSCADYVAEGSILCETCRSHLYPVAPLYKKVGDYSVGIYAFAKYHGPMRRMILSKKYGKRAVFYGLAELMLQHSIIPYLEVDCFVAVPLHWTRRLHRGFNQSEIIAGQLAGRLSVPVASGVTRKKRTRFQSSLSKEERLKNVESVFSIRDKSSFKNKRVVIVDDLYTTGATVLSLAREIAKCRPASIQVVACCR